MKVCCVFSLESSPPVHTIYHSQYDSLGGRIHLGGKGVGVGGGQNPERKIMLNISGTSWQPVSI